MNIPRILIRALLLCNYRTHFYDDFQKLTKKVKTYHNKILMFST